MKTIIEVLMMLTFTVLVTCSVISILMVTMPAKAGEPAVIPDHFHSVSAKWHKLGRSCLWEVEFILDGKSIRAAVPAQLTCGDKTNLNINWRK